MSEFLENDEECDCEECDCEECNCEECNCEEKYLVEVDSGLFQCENCGKLHGIYSDFVVIK